MLANKIALTIELSVPILISVFFPQANFVSVMQM